MTDRELLELAAKAIGRELEIIEYWDPLNDDGDALRLAVKALNWPHGGNAFDNAVADMVAVNQLPKDAHSATRRAIVMAAAKIGQNQLHVS